MPKTLTITDEGSKKSRIKYTCFLISNLTIKIYEILRINSLNIFYSTLIILKRRQKNTIAFISVNTVTKCLQLKSLHGY